MGSRLRGNDEKESFSSFHDTQDGYGKIHGIERRR
jgi:hypothetical protein